jgi:hypothetical protein
MLLNAKDARQYAGRFFLWCTANSVTITLRSRRRNAANGPAPNKSESRMVWPIMSGAATQGSMFGVLRRQSQRKAPHSPLITSEASFADSILPLREW